jgi:hypothetical protein
MSTIDEQTTDTEDFLRKQRFIGKQLDYVRYLGALYETDGSDVLAAKLFAARFPRSPNTDLLLKTVTAPGTTIDSTWAGPLAPPQVLAEAFVGYVRPLTIVGRLPLRRTPFNVKVPQQTGAGVYGWSPEGGLKKVTQVAYGTLTLGITKCSAIIVVTSELMKLSVPSAELLLRDELSAGLAQLVDTTFVNDALAPGGGSPGSILNGVTPVTPSGTTEAALARDVSTLVSQFLTNNPDPTRARLVMGPTHAAMLQHATNSPTLTVDGGSVYGLPVIISANAGARVIALDGAQILLGDNGVVIDLSRQASIELDDAPTGSAASVMTSLWQSNLVGFRADWFISWKKTTSTAASWLGPTAYVPGT